MRRTTTLVLAGAVLMVGLAACSGGSEEDPGATRVPASPQGAAKDADRRGPAPEVDGAAAGGTITVYLPGESGPDTLDPTAGWSRAGNSIQQALISRSLTQYARDGSGRPVLVPDLATDLGRPNADFTEWTFTIRDDARWEDGRPVTADEVAFGICRSLDSEAFPDGPGTKYSKRYFADSSYKGPYTGQDPRCAKWGGVSVDGQDVTITMSTPFPDMDYWGAFMAMGPSPMGNASRPPTYGHMPLSNGPYKVANFVDDEELTLVRNDQWDPATDPARHQYVDRWVFKFNQDLAAVDELMLSDSADAQTAISTALSAERYNQVTDELGDRLVQQTTPCVSMLVPDYTKITDIRVRKALAYAYPHDDVWIAAGGVPKVTRMLANSLLPPGTAGKKEFFVDDAQISYDPVNSRELLAQAGHAAKPYPITMIYYEVDPMLKAVQERITQGLEAGGFSVRSIPVQTSPFDVWLDPDNKTNKLLNLRSMNYCADWPVGSSMLPALLEAGSDFNFASFDEPSLDREMDKIASLPHDDQPGAWGSLDQKIMTEYFPIIPTAFRGDLYVFGEKIGNPTGDGSMGAPNYKDLYVTP